MREGLSHTHSPTPHATRQRESKVSTAGFIKTVGALTAGGAGRAGSENPRFKGENIITLELDMPERTTRDYQDRDLLPDGLLPPAPDADAWPLVLFVCVAVGFFSWLFGGLCLCVVCSELCGVVRMLFGRGRVREGLFGSGLGVSG